MRTNQRGSALLTAMIAVVVLVVVALGILRFASRARIGASAAVNEQALVACAEAARLQLMAQFHLFGSPGSVTALNVPLGTTGGGNAPQAVGGHYDTPVGKIVIDQATPLPTIGPSVNVAAGDLTGKSSASATQGSTPWKVVVHCDNGSGRQLEVEFGIQMVQGGI